MFMVKRIYDPASDDDGRRFLVDRLWPRGVSKDKARLAAWLKELSPSTGLREWFHREPDKWEEFKERYRAELGQPALARSLWDLRGLGRRERVTLLYAARDVERNNALVLKEFLETDAGDA